MEYNCRECNNLTAVPDGMEKPGHELCWPCSSGEVTRLLGVMKDRQKRNQERVDQWVKIADEEREKKEAVLLQVSELQKKLAQIKEAVCRECSGSGEIGLADGEVHCPTCGGSGDPLKPGLFAKKRKEAP